MAATTDQSTAGALLDDDPEFLAVVVRGQEGCNIWMATVRLRAEMAEGGLGPG